MAIVPLRFPPPEETNIVALRVYEGTTPEGPFVEIVRVSPVGTYPTYITHYTVSSAVDENNWFTIRWEDADGALSPYSEAVQGGTTTLVGEITARVARRDPSLDEEVVAEEAEAVIEGVFGRNNTPDVNSVSKRQLSGMTLLTMVRVQVGKLAVANTGGGSWTAGLVSMKTDTNSSLNVASLRSLMLEAQRMLGLSNSRVAQMIMPQIAGGLSEIKMADISRLLIDVE